VKAGEILILLEEEFQRLRGFIQEKP